MGRNLKLEDFIISNDHMTFALPDCLIFFCNSRVAAQVNSSGLQSPLAAVSVDYLRPVNINLKIDQNL